MLCETTCDLYNTVIFNVYLFIYFERERERERNGREREREKERMNMNPKQALCFQLVSTEPSAGLNLMNCVLMT